MQLSWIALHKRAVKHYEDIEFLQGILFELQFRRTRAARTLYVEIAAHVAELSAREKHTFRWPSTAVCEDSNQALSGTYFEYEEGLLKFMGYTVGQNGAYRNQRRQVLDYVYNERVPMVQSQEYMDEWGRPKTAQRLQKMANSLATFARNAKRRHNYDMRLAVNEWEEDLAYLKKKYYNPSSFRWPE